MGRRYKREIGNCERRAGAACGACQVLAAFCVFAAPVCQFLLFVRPCIRLASLVNLLPMWARIGFSIYPR